VVLPVVGVDGGAATSATGGGGSCRDADELKYIANIDCNTATHLFCAGWEVLKAEKRAPILDAVVDLVNNLHGSNFSCSWM
jgi:hypothetical protein